MKEIHQDKDALIEKDFVGDEYFLGEVKVLWKQCLKTPSELFINNIFKIQNISFEK